MWAIGIDYGTYEGQRPPLTLVDDEATAMGLKKIFEETYFSSVYVVEVPVWPEIRTVK